MKNWAGNVVWNPSEIAYPTSEADIQAIVLRAAKDQKKIRMIGSGHSFSALCKTDQILMSLDKFQGLVEVDKNNYQAVVKGGTKLNTLGNLLFEQGMEMENLGDIDTQSIAGTISTSTHGTGTQFGTISTQVIAIRFINGKGEIVNCSTTENQELFKAAQVSLGVLGVITQITLQCVPSYKLKVHMKGESMKAVIPNIEEHIKNNRNFEYYWLPYTDKIVAKTSNVVEGEAVHKSNIWSYLNEYLLENYAFNLFCEYARWFPSQTQSISKLTAKFVTDTERVHQSHKIYATQRLVKFREMEYNIPAEAFQEVWKKVVQTVDSGKFNVHFPLEVRWVKGDDILMSPAYGRDSVYIACHVYSNKDCMPYFNALEEIFRAHDGRPHWGKMSTLRHQDVAAMYPKYSTFMKHRATQDPHNIFISPYLKKLLGVSENKNTSTNLTAQHK